MMKLTAFRDRIDAKRSIFGQFLEILVALWQDDAPAK
jgi:hypothetical protein